MSTEGTMSIHGVDKALSISGFLTREGKSYHAQFFFSLDIADFNIGKPRFLLASMDKTVRLKLDFYLIREDVQD